MITPFRNIAFLPSDCNGTRRDDTISPEENCEVWHIKIKRRAGVSTLTAFVEKWVKLIEM